MKKTIPHRELRNESSRVLREVEAGATFEITNHGAVVAILTPPSERPARSRSRAATIRGGFASLTTYGIDHPIQATLDDLSSDR